MNTPSLTPPSSAPTKTPRTWPDVFAQFVGELPPIMIICVVGIIALSDHSKATEMVLTLFGYFNYKSSPPDKTGARSIAPLAVMGGILIVGNLMGCGARPTDAQLAQGAKYGIDQLVCVAIEKAKVDKGLQTKADGDARATECRNAVKSQSERLDGGAQ